MMPLLPVFMNGVGVPIPCAECGDYFESPLVYALHECAGRAARLERAFRMGAIQNESGPTDQRAEDVLVQNQKEGAD